jgi:hypothetical protein
MEPEYDDYLHKQIGTKLSNITERSRIKMTNALNNGELELYKQISTDYHTEYINASNLFSTNYEAYIERKNAEKKKMFENTVYLHFSQGRNSTMKRIMNGTSQLNNVREWLREQQTLRGPPYNPMSYYGPSTTKNTTFNMKLKHKHNHNHNHQSPVPEPMDSCCCGSWCGFGGDTTFCCNSCGMCGCGGSNCCGCGTLITAGNVCMNGTYVIQLQSTLEESVLYLNVSCGYAQYVPTVSVNLSTALLQWATYYFLSSKYSTYTITVIPFIPSGSFGTVLGKFPLQNCYFWGSDTCGNTGNDSMNAFTSYSNTSCVSLFNDGQYPQGMA